MRRGEVWWANLRQPWGRRPVVLLARNEAYDVLNWFLAAPLTTTIRSFGTQVPLDPRADGVTRACVVNLDEMQAIRSEWLDALIAEFPGRMRELRRLLQNNPIWRDRTIDVGTITSEEAVQWGLTGPSLRGSGIAYDVRKAFPYSGYETYEFDVPVRSEGDAYARFLVRLDEMDEAMRIVRQARERLEVPGPVVIDDPKIVAPPKETIAISMEALIHHFKIVSEGFRVPPGDVYQAIESPRGEMAYYLVSNGNNRPYRVRTRPPSLYNLQCLKKIAVGNFIADMVVMIGSLDPVFGEVDR